MFWQSCHYCYCYYYCYRFCFSYQYHYCKQLLLVVLILFLFLLLFLLLLRVDVLTAESLLPFSQSFVRQLPAQRRQAQISDLNLTNSIWSSCASTNPGPNTQILTPSISACQIQTSGFVLGLRAGGCCDGFHDLVSRLGVETLLARSTFP